MRTEAMGGSGRRDVLAARIRPDIFWLWVAYLGEGDVGNDNGVDGAGGLAGLLVLVAAGVVAVGTLAGVGLPGRASLGDVLLGGGGGGGGSCEVERLAGVLPSILRALPSADVARGVSSVCTARQSGGRSTSRRAASEGGGRTEVETGAGEGADHDTAENLWNPLAMPLLN